MDYISELPECILGDILSMLPVKDVLRSSLVSKRWSSNLWAHRRDLNFDVHGVLGSEKELLQFGYLNDLDDGDENEYGDDEEDDGGGDGGGDIDGHVDINGHIDEDVDNNGDVDIDGHADGEGDGEVDGDDSLDYDPIRYYLELSQCGGEFIKRVDQFIKSFQGTKIDSFAVEFYLDSEQRSTINQWISFAIAKGVERIDLLFTGEPYAIRDRDKEHELYEFPFDLFSESNASTLKRLCLENCLVHHHSINFDFTPFTNLRSLELERVEVDKFFITTLLSNCRPLEELGLISCVFNPSVPKIVSSSLCHLKVSCCMVPFGELYNKFGCLRTLDCPKLTSLNFDDDPKAMCINIPVVRCINYRVTFDGIPNAFAFFATLPQLEILNLDITIYKKVEFPLKITQPLKHLKQLTLEFGCRKEEFDLLWILTILQAIPLLQKLSVMVTNPKLFANKKDIKDLEIFSHDKVKVIEIGGCVGNWFEIEFAMNVLKYAHNLERIVMSPYWRNYTIDWKSHPFWFQNGRERIREQIQGLAIGRVELVLI